MLGRNTLRPITAAVSLVGFVSSFISVAFAPAFALKVPILCTLGAASIGACVWSSMQALKRRHPLVVRGHLCPPDFDISFALGHRIYTRRLKKPYPTREQADGWLRHYSRGVFQIYDQTQRCWGYFSMWPLHEDTFQKLKLGALTESDLIGSMIAPANAAPFTYWYVADILKDNARFHPNVSNSYFAQYLCSLLIHDALSRLMREKQFAYPFELIGCAVTRPGEQWLKKFHFQHVLTPAEEKGVHKVYLRTLTRDALLRLLKQLKDTIDEHEREICRLTLNH